LIAGLKRLPCRLVEQPYIEHAAAVDLMCGADALCLLLSDLPGAGRVVPAKLFEYFASRRPIPAIAPRGETWDLLDAHPKAGRFIPMDVGGIAGWLADAVEARKNNRNGAVTPQWDASAFDRNHEAGQLATFLESLLPGRTQPVFREPERKNQ